jgi:hypothetical protein
LITEFHALEIAHDHGEFRRLARMS